MCANNTCAFFPCGSLGEYHCIGNKYKKIFCFFFIVIVSIMYGGYNWVKRNKDFCLEHICFTKRKEQVFYFLLLIAFFLMLLIAFSLEVDVYNTWDYGQLIRSAYETVINGKLEIQRILQDTPIIVFIC